MQDEAQWYYQRAEASRASNSFNNAARDYETARELYLRQEQLSRAIECAIQRALCQIEAALQEIELISDVLDALEFYLTEMEMSIREIAGGQLFSLGLEFRDDFDTDNISDRLRQEFKDRGIELSPEVTVLFEEEGSEWLIIDQAGERIHSITKKQERLLVSGVKLPKSVLVSEMVYTFLPQRRREHRLRAESGRAIRAPLFFFPRFFNCEPSS